MINLVVVDAQPAYLNSLSMLLSLDTHIQLIALVASGREAIDFLETTHQRIDIVILSLQLQRGTFNGVPLAKYILKHFATIKLLVYSVHEVGKYIDEMYNSGVSGYLFMDSSKQEFLEAIHQVNQGEIYYSARAKGIVSRYFQSKELSPNTFKGFPS